MDIRFSDYKVGAIRRYLTRVFSDAGISTALSDASDLIGHVLELDYAGIVAAANTVLTSDELNNLEGLAGRRLSGEPVDNILGLRHFFGFNFRVNAHVLSPRADTECLVEKALALVTNISKPRILDLGTGSGAVAISLAKMKAGAEIQAGYIP